MSILIQPIVSLVSDVLKRVLPEKISETEKLKIETEINKSLVQLEYEDRDSARKLGQKELEKGNAYTTALAAIHRPIWSIVMLLIFVWTLISEQLGLPKIILSDAHTSIMQTVIIFYFGGRSIEKVLKKT